MGTLLGPHGTQWLYRCCCCPKKSHSLGLQRSCTTADPDVSHQCMRSTSSSRIDTRSDRLHASHVHKIGPLRPLPSRASAVILIVASTDGLHSFIPAYVFQKARGLSSSCNLEIGGVRRRVVLTQYRVASSSIITTRAGGKVKYIAWGLNVVLNHAPKEVRPCVMAPLQPRLFRSVSQHYALHDGLKGYPGVYNAGGRRYCNRHGHVATHMGKAGSWGDLIPMTGSGNAMHPALRIPPPPDWKNLGARVEHLLVHEAGMLSDVVADKLGLSHVSII
jgi:hypothetical protein